MANKKLTRNPNYALRLRDAQDKGLIITKNEGDRFGYLASGIDFSNINNQEMANSIIVNTFDKINQYFDSYRELAIIDQIKDTRYRCTFNKEETKKKFKKLVDDIQSICNKTKELYQKTNLDYDRNDMDKSIRNFTEVYAVSMFSNHKLMNENILKQAKSLIQQWNDLSQLLNDLHITIEERQLIIDSYNYNTLDQLSYIDIKKDLIAYYTQLTSKYDQFPSFNEIMHNEDAYIPYLKTHEEALENSNLAEFKDLDYKNDIIYFALDLPNNDQFINNVRTFTEQLKKAHFPSKLCLRINVSDTYLTKDQIEALIELDAILQSKQCTPLHIIDSGNKMFESTFEIGNEYKNGYSLSVITKLNNTIDQLVTNIQERQLSPTEAMVYIHHYVSSMFIYRESHNLTFYFEGNKASAFIPGINKQYLVCCGFTDLVKTIVDRCNDLHIWDNQQECSLSCQEVNTIIYENKDGSDIESIMKGESSSLEYGGHSSTMLTITDPKYGLLDYKGYSDSMWEENSNKMVPTFQHFLLPANTIYFHKNRDIKLTGKKIFSKNFIDTENTSSISDQVSDTTLDRKTLEKALFTTFAKVFPLRSFNDMKDYFTSVIDWSVNSNNPWEDEIRIFKGQSTPLLSEDEMFELYITAIKELPNSSILNEQSKIIDKANNLQNPNFSQFRKYDESLYDRSKRNNSIWGANSKELLDAIKHLDNTTDNRSI